MLSAQHTAHEADSDSSTPHQRYLLVHPKSPLPLHENKLPLLSSLCREKDIPMPKKKEGQEVVEPERDKGTTAEKKEEPEEIEQEIKKEEDIASSSDDSSSPRTRDRKKSDDDRKARSTLKVTNLACKLKEKEDSVRMFLQSSGEEADGEKQESKKRRRRKNRSLRATKSNGNSHDEQEDNAVDPLQEDNAKVSVSPDSNHAVNTTRSSKIGLETRLKTSNSAAKNGEAGPQQVATPDQVRCRLLFSHYIS